MTKKNPFFLIGTLGILLTAISNILLEAIVVELNSISSLSIFYPVFMVFLLIGAGGMVKNNDRFHNIKS